MSAIICVDFFLFRVCRFLLFVAICPVNLLHFPFLKAQCLCINNGVFGFLLVL